MNLSPASTLEWVKVVYTGVDRNDDNIESWRVKKNSLNTCSTHEQTYIVLLPLVFGAQRFPHLIESSAMVSPAVWLKFN